MHDCQIQGEPVPHDLIAPLHDSSADRNNSVALQSQLENQGYVLLRGVVARETIQAARHEVFSQLESVGEIRSPAVDGLATGYSRRQQMHPDLRSFWRNVSNGRALRAATHGTDIMSCMSHFFASPLPHDYLFLRPGRVGLSTRLHYDLPFFARGSNRILTVWMALGDIPISEGTLMVIEGSHRFHDLIEPMRQIDYDSPRSSPIQIMENSIEFVRGRQSRFLTSDFGAGDVIIFGMTTLHGTCDNHSPLGRVRLSCDLRWQPSRDPIDARYQGEDPPGTTGAGYGELNGAKPLTEDWHSR